uniref:Uncharacterized protein n=1 Tax=viral metagenome TaxID=1070528 RepID=A0A6C0D5E4_9ZZZZ
MSINLDTRLLLNNLIKQKYTFFKSLENVFARYLLDQYRYPSDYPDEPPFYLITSIYELNRIVIDYCVYGASRITSPHDATGDMIKYKFWLYYNMNFGTAYNEKIITRFNKVVDKCVAILKINNEVIVIHCNPLMNISSCFPKPKN